MRIGQKLSLPLGIVIIGNLISCIIFKDPFIYYIMYVGIFIPIIIALLLFPKNPKNKIVSIILLLLSCIGIWFGGDSNLISATLFCFAIYIAKPEKRTIYIYSGSLIISMILKFTFMGLNIPQFFVIIAGSAFILVLYQHYIHPRQNKAELKEVVVFRPDLNVKKIIILQKLYSGIIYKQIAWDLNCTEESIQGHVKRLKEKFNVKTTQELKIKSKEMGFIDMIIDKRELE